MASKDVVLSVRVPRRIADQIKQHCESAGVDVSGFLLQLVARELSIEIGRKKANVADMAAGVRGLQTQVEQLQILANLVLAHQIAGNVDAVDNQQYLPDVRRELINKELARVTSRLPKLAPLYLAPFEPALGMSVLAPVFSKRKG